MRISDWSSDVCSSDLTPSVISTSSRVGESPFLLSDERITVVRFGLANCSGDRLIARRILSGQFTASAQAERITHSPTEVMRPASSAIGTTLSGGTSPRAGRSEENTYELQSLIRISYTAF